MTVQHALLCVLAVSIQASNTTASAFLHPRPLIKVPRPVSVSIQAAENASTASNTTASPNNVTALPRPVTGLPPLNATADGVCGHLLDRASTAGRGMLAPGFDHERLARDMAASPRDLAALHVPPASPCAGHETWSRTLLIYRHCTNLRRTARAGACSFLDVKRFSDSLTLASGLEKQEAQRGCAARGLRPCRFYSQMAEDAVLFNMFFKNQRGGTYLEMGALDGVTYSNTLFFQETLGWKGVLIEPGPKFGALERNRGSRSKAGGRNILHNLAVCSKPGTVTFQYVAGSEAEGGLDQPTRLHGKGGSLRSHSVRCDTLGNILKASGVGQIDLFSLDVEGRELEVLRSMNWEVGFKVLVMERTRDHEEIDKLLLSKGYQYIREQRGNVIWALRTFKPVQGSSSSGEEDAVRSRHSGDAVLSSYHLPISSKFTIVTLGIVGFLLVALRSRRRALGTVESVSIVQRGPGQRRLTRRLRDSSGWKGHRREDQQLQLPIETRPHESQRRRHSLPMTPELEDRLEGEGGRTEEWGGSADRVFIV